MFAYHDRMEQAARIERWTCRRREPRFRLGTPARLIALERHFAVTLEDLSEGGAKVTLPELHAFGVCVLRWMDYHVFAEVRWTRECVVGLQFVSPISAEMLEQTRLGAPDMLTQLKPREPLHLC
jgi:hypothetical protein